MRRSVVLSAGVVLGVAIAVLATLQVIAAASGGEVSVLIGALESGRIMFLASVAGIVAVTAGLCAVAVSGQWVIPLALVRLAAIGVSCLGLFAAWVTGSATVAPIVSGGCETGYVVVEESFLLSGTGTVYRADGMVATAVATTVGDDGYHPFDDGAYAVAEHAGGLQVWYDVSSSPSGEPVSTNDGPAFVLPERTDRVFACGIVVARSHAIQPAPNGVPEYEVDEIRASVRKMVDMSVAVAVGPVRDAAGRRFDLEALDVTSNPCDDGGVVVSIGLEFETADNATSLTRILSAWEAAGYQSDRAMQHDIRFSETLPIETMSMSDSTTIDGLLHMQITSRCGAP